LADLEKQIAQQRLTTAQILYHMPDHVLLLQEFIWQDYDLAPHFPNLRKFLNFWEKEIEGKLHSVFVAYQGLITPGDTRFTAWEGAL